MKWVWWKRDWPSSERHYFQWLEFDRFVFCNFHRFWKVDGTALFLSYMKIQEPILISNKHWIFMFHKKELSIQIKLDKLRLGLFFQIVFMNLILRKTISFVIESHLDVNKENENWNNGCIPLSLFVNINDKHLKTLSLLFLIIKYRIVL